jgi:cis-3-alkyl-4-acyloxetan-2-one decarboxylase
MLRFSSPGHQMSRDSAPEVSISRMLTDAKLPDLPEWLHELYPFRTRTIELGPYRMSFVDEGRADAPALLLLHGNPTWSFLFRQLIQQASPRRRVIAPDLIGFGLSDKPREQEYHTLERHIENLSMLVEALELRDITLVGHGWGGPVAMGYAAQHADNIARLALCSTWALPVADAHRVKLPLRIRLANSGGIGRFLESLLNLSMSAWVSSRAFLPPSDWTVEGYKYPFPTMASRAAIGAFSRMFFDPSEGDRATMKRTYEGLKRVTAPADILVGETDPLKTKLPAYLMRDALPNAHEPVFVAKASHLIPEDAPQALAEIVLREEPARSHDRPSSLFKILK